MSYLFLNPQTAWLLIYKCTQYIIYYPSSLHSDYLMPVSLLILRDNTLGQTLSSFIIYNSISSLNFWGFFCLFWGLSSHSRIVLSYEDVTTAGKVLQILTYARHSWSLSSEGSLACHNYCDMGRHFLGPVTLTQWNGHYLFLRLRSVVAGIWKPNQQSLRVQRSNPLRHRRVTIFIILSVNPWIWLPV